jgi:hypothetical protein
VPHTFFADKMMPRQATGLTLFYLLHSVDGVMPLDLTEATFLVGRFCTNMPREELLSLQICQLEKQPRDLASAAKSLYHTCIQSKEVFERCYAHKLRSRDYAPGSLVLVRNSMIEKSPSCKSKPHYFGPFEIQCRTQGGSYVLEEMDGVLHQRAIAATRLLPYFQQEGELRQDLMEEEDELQGNSEEEAKSLNDSDIE